MGAGRANIDLSDEEFVAEQKRLQEKLENQVQYDPAFTAQLNQISGQIPAVAETIVNILFDKPKVK
jgi:hypothetical protein